MRPIATIFFLAIVLSSTLAAAPPARSQTEIQIDPCSALRPAAVDDEKSWWDTLLDRFWRSGTAADTSGGEEIGELKYTITSDYSIQPVCRGRQRLATSMYYPVGLVVRSLAFVRIGRHRFELVETEYGVRLYVNPKHLRALAPELLYVFADSSQRLPFCLRPDCSDEDKASATARGLVLWPQSPNAAYAIVADPDEVAKSGQICGTFAAHIMSDRAATYAAADHRSAPTVYIDTCVTDRASGRQAFDPRYKLVSREAYKALFELDIDGTFQQLDTSLVAAIFASASLSKDCSETYNTATKKFVKAGAEIGKELFAIKIAAGASIEKVIERVRKLDEKIFSRYNPYKVNLPDLTTYVSNIAVMYQCDERGIYPEQPYRLEVDFTGVPNVQDYIISLSSAQISQTYKDFHAHQGQVISVNPDDYLRGKLWRVGGAPAYFQLRDVLTSLIFPHSAIDPLLADADDARKYTERRKIAAFLAHVIMAAASSFR